MSRAKKTGAVLAALGSAATVAAQGSGQAGALPAGPSVGPTAGSDAAISVSTAFDAWFPALLDPSSVFSTALGGTAQLSYAPFPFFQALARAGVYSLATGGGGSVLYVGGSAGLGFTARLFERVSVGLSGHVGLGRASYGSADSTGLYELGARLETSFRLSAALSLGLAAGYERLANPNHESSFLDAIGATLSLRITPSEMAIGRSKLAIEKVETQTVFPVFRAWYDAEPLGTVTVRNDEDGPVEDVRVSFYAPAYMGGPRVCATVKRIEKGQSAVVPLYAVFDERVLKLTESGSTSAQVDVEYAFYGSRRTARQGLDLSLHHRNAMSWEDDRRAAAFVSPTDPAALWFSRYAASVVRDRLRGELPANLQYALGIFESLRLYGLNYVIDPNSAYVDMSENAAVIDYLQYPSQTLMYRGGDCDDLSILYCSLLEASGIPTAFITIPGHIYMAFELGLSEAEARERFFDPGLLLFRDGRAWAPVEITMVKEGFVKAWRVGAKQWIDNDRAGSAAFFAMRDNWKAYKPSGLQDAQARFALPDEARAMAAFDSGVDRFMAREMELVVAEYERKLAAAREPELLNEYGTALAKVGMLDPAWERFVEASKAGYAWAWNNLASVAFVRKDYALAYSYYEWATTLLPGDPVAVLGMARCAYELDRYSEATILYEGLKEEAPALAARYGYLASAYGGTGRAWSMADRLAGSVWSRPGLSFDLPATAPAVAAAPPAPPAAASPASVSVAPPAPVIAPAGPPASVVVAPSEPPAAKAEPATELAAEIEAAVEAEAETVAPIERAAAVVAAPEPEPVVTVERQAEPGPDSVEAEAEEAAPIEQAAAIVAAPGPEPVFAIAEPEPEPEPAPVEPEAAIVTAPVPEPVVAVELAPAPNPAPAPTEPAKPAESATVRALAALKAQVAAAKADEATAPGAQAKSVTTKGAPVAVPAPVVAPPAVVERPPEDAEIAAKAAEAASVAIEPPPPPVAIAPPVAPAPTQAPIPATVAPPAVIERPPEDAEIAAKAAESASVAIAPPPAVVAVAPPVVAPPTAEPMIVAPPSSEPVVVAPPADPAPPAQAIVATQPTPPAPQDDEAERAAIAAARAAAQAVAASTIDLGKSKVTEPIPAPIPAPMEPVPSIAPVPTEPAAPLEVALAIAPAPTEPAATTPREPEAPQVTIIKQEPEPAKAAPKPAFAPTARFAPTVDRGSLPAFGKRLPEGADASGYERAPIPAVTVAQSLPAPRAVALSGPGTRVATGKWKRSDASAAMSDAKAMYAKLVVETPGLEGAARYEFQGRATGSGWVGFGLHLHGRGAWRQSGYGGGDSILVWITSDPKAYGDPSPRLQVYRSLGEVDMRLIATERLAGSAFASRAVRVDYDPAAGTLAVSVDGAPALSLTGLTNPAGSDYVALRALDLAEFADLTIAPLPPSSPTPETRP